MNKSSGKYFVKRKSTDEYVDLTAMFNGLAVLSVDGMNEEGDAVNVYHEQWVDEQKEDFLVTKQVTNDNVTSDVIIRSNVDLRLTFIISRRYTNELIDVQTVYDSFIDYVCKSGSFYIKSLFANKEAQVVCLKSVKPTTQKMNVGYDNYILATIELHSLDKPQAVQPTPVTGQELYIGFGGSAIASISSLSNLQHFTNLEDVAGNYSALCTSTSYLWICSTMNIDSVTSSGFEVPLNDSVVVLGDFLCYRSANRLLSDTINFTINT